MGERAAGQSRQEADGHDVDRGRDEREPGADGADVDPARIAALQAEKTASVTRKAVSSGFGCTRLALRANRAIAGKRSQATMRSASAVAPSARSGPPNLRTAYSMRPRRMAVATAAARSETPSFSYRCCTCVFTVVRPR